jgi:hypothetical protein
MAASLAPGDVFYPHQYYYRAATNQHFAWEATANQWIEFLPDNQPYYDQEPTNQRQQQHSTDDLQRQARNMLAEQKSQPKLPPYVKATESLQQRRIVELQKELDSCPTKYDMTKQNNYLQQIKAERDTLTAKALQQAASEGQGRRAVGVDRAQLSDDFYQQTDWMRDSRVQKANSELAVAAARDFMRKNSKLQ